MSHPFIIQIAFFVTLFCDSIYAQDTQPAPPPVTSQAAATQSAPAQADLGLRIEDFVGLLVGANSATTRQTGARELLRIGSPEAISRLALVLQSADAEARIAVARTVADAPDLCPAELLDALSGMLADAAPEVRSAAVAALGSVGGEQVVGKLAGIARNTQANDQVRLAAVETLGVTMQRDALAVLVELLADPSSAVASAALTAIERAAAMEFHGDAAAVAAWWEESRAFSPEQWRQSRMRRLIAENADRRRRIEALERRLTGVLRDAYIRSTEENRAGVLAEYLNDPTESVRVLGLELAQARIAEGKEFGAELRQRVRALLQAPEPAVRAAAVQAIAALRDPTDEQRFLDLLAGERESVVRQALLNGLGYAGTDASVTALIAWVSNADVHAANEAITALGRLATRNVLASENRQRIAQELLARYESVPAANVATRERLLGALGPLSDPRCGATFVGALAGDQPVATRLAAIRGIGLLLAAANGEPSVAPPVDSGTVTVDTLVAALTPGTVDADGGVRRACVELLGQYGHSDEVLAALWERLAGSSEVDENIRNVAWKGVARILEQRPADQILAWVERLPVNGALQGRRTQELLLIAERKLAADPSELETLGRTRARIAALQVTNDKLDEALASYQQAVTDLRAARSDAAQDAAFELLRLALFSERYDEGLAVFLATDPPAIDGARLWERLRPLIEERMKPELLALALRLLDQLQTTPPVEWSSDTREDIRRTQQHATDLLAAAAREEVNAALVAMRADPQDAAARDRIMSLGKGAIPALRAALEATLDSKPLDVEAERRIHDLLKQLMPAWPGFAADAPLEEKRRVIAAIEV